MRLAGTPPRGHQRAVGITGVVLLHAAVLLLWYTAPAPQGVQAHREAPALTVVQVSVAPLPLYAARPLPERPSRQSAPANREQRQAAPDQQHASPSVAVPGLQDFPPPAGDMVASAGAGPFVAPPQAVAPAPAPTPRLPADLPDSTAQYLYNPAPVYPQASRRRGEQGRVLVSALVSAEGKVVEASIESSSGFARLDDAALMAVRSWRFSPAMRGDVAVQKRHTIPLVFVLSGA